MWRPGRSAFNDSLGPMTRSLVAWIAGWALSGLLVAVWVCLGPLEGIPHVEDEIVYQFQAGVLADGALWAQEALPRAAHHYIFVVSEEGRRFGVFPNGWPAVLALGTLLGLPWLVNPLLHACAVVLGSVLGHRLGSRPLALVAAPLLALSPGLVLHGASRMSHALCAVLVLAALVAAAGPPGRVRGLLVGLALGGLALARPMDGLVAALVVAAWVVLRDRRRALAWWPALLPMAGAVLLTAVQNQLLTGSSTLFAADYYFGLGRPAIPNPAFRYEPGCNSLGFGPLVGCEPSHGSLGHTPSKALANIWFQLRLAGPMWLGSWALFPLAVIGALSKNGRKVGVLGAALWLGLALGYGLYWYVGVCLGPRFHHSAAPLVVLAVAAGLVWALERVRWPPVVALLALTLPVWKLGQVLVELPGYWGVDDRLSSLESQWAGGPALMLVAYGPPYNTAADLEHTVGARLNYLGDRRRGAWMFRDGGELAYAEFHPELVDATRARHPDLPVYVYVFHADVGDDRVVPLASLGELPAQLEDLPLPVAPFPLELSR